MLKSKEDTAVAVAEAPAPSSKRKTYTPWDAFVKAKLVPVSIVCDTIRGRQADEACHTRLALTADSIIRHISELDHGGGFKIQFKKTDGKPWQGWKDLEDAGFEIAGLKCVPCDEKVQVSPRDLLNHMRQHGRGISYNWHKDTLFFRIQSTPVNDENDFSDDSEQ
jgi:hypothetical protein